MLKRGKPDENELVHFCIEGLNGHEDNALCYNGAWNIIFTDIKSQVTCPHCIEKLGK